MLTQDYLKSAYSSTNTGASSNTTFANDDEYQKWANGSQQASPASDPARTGALADLVNKRNSQSTTSVGDFASNMATGAYNAGKSAVGGIADALHQNQQVDTSNQSLLQKMGSQASTGIDLGAKAISAPFEVAGGALGALVPQRVKDAVSTGAQAVGQEFAQHPEAMNAVNTIKDLIAQHPLIARTVGDLATTALNVAGMGGVDAVAPIAKDAVVDAAKGAVSTGGNILKSGVEGVKAIPDAVGQAGSAVSNAVTSVMPTKQNDAQIIKDMIMPKPTAKEARLAMDENRLYRGEQGGLLTSGTADEVAATPQVAKSVQTIQRLIPDAAKLDDATLYSELSNKVIESAKALQPELEKTPINYETVNKMTTDWEKLKQTQIADAPASEELNVAKRQDKFQSFMDKTKLNNFNDLWETAKSYDATIPDRVKQANNLSSESVQLQKDEWMDNRSILKQAINDTENGLGETSRAPFSDMHDMYEAQNGILSKAKINQTGAPSKAVQFMKDHPVLRKGAAIAGAGAVGVPIVKSLGGG